MANGQNRLERLEILSSCYEVKAVFPTRPGAEVVREIQQHIKSTGLPHTWRGHTHTKPPRKARVEYLDEFDLPVRLVKARRLAPCPCCWAEYPKYGAGGKIAWFPDEQVVRLLGPDCFRALNPEGHDAAVDKLNVERQRKRVTEFLLANVPKLRAVIGAMEEALGVARASAEFHRVLDEKLRVSKLDLWPHVRDGGKLSIRERQREFQQRRVGSPEVREIEVLRVFAELPGFEMLDPQLPSYARRLEKALKRLGELRGWLEARDVVGMTDEEKANAVKSLSSTVSRVKQTIGALESVRRFVEQVSINTLRAWGEHEGCVVRRFYRHDGNQIRFGRSEDRCLIVPIPKALLDRIRPIDFWFELGSSGEIS